MSVTRAQLIANTREMMDATSSARWQDPYITTVLGLVSGREWSAILATNPYYRFAQRAVTTDSNGQFAYTALNSGSADSAQTWYRILAITDGNSIVYRQTSFQAVPLATSSNSSSPYERLWYDAGTNAQVLPVSPGLALTVAVNYTPPRVDQLSADAVTVDFPDGHESILWLEAAAFLLSKGGMENDAAQTMRAMAELERQNLYGDMNRRAATPMQLGYPDLASEWSA